MREVVFINIGQAGVQISNAIWELFCVEHDISADGTSVSEFNEEAGTVFNQVPNGQYVPRVVTVDLEPTVLDEVRTGSYRKLFHPDQLISGNEDAANNYARGHFTMGRKVIDQCVNQIRKVAQSCTFVQGFFMINSLGGGTGSGLAILLNEKLSIEYTKRPKFQIGVYPSPKMESCVVSPYNTIMNTHASMEYVDLSIIMDNEATYDICIDSLMIQRPTFNNINRLISQVLSSMTVSLRFENCLNSDLDQMCTNLVPYPRIHFPTSHHAPLQCQSRIEHEVTDELELTRMLFTSCSQFVKVDCSLGKLMACVMQYRGMINPKNVNRAILEIKLRHDISFVDWCPTGFKVGINSFPPTVIPSSSLASTTKSVTMLCNTTAICQMWKKLNLKFDVLFHKRAFVHWFVGEGMEEGEFTEGKDSVESIIIDYLEATLSQEEFTGAAEDNTHSKAISEKENFKYSSRSKGSREESLKSEVVENSISKPILEPKSEELMVASKSEDLIVTQKSEEVIAAPKSEEVIVTEN